MSVVQTNQVLSPRYASLLVMSLTCLLTCCSHDTPAAEVTNKTQMIPEQTSGGISMTTKAAKKRAAKRRGQARSTNPMSCVLLTCILVFPSVVTYSVQRLSIIDSFAAHSFASCFVSPLLHHIAAMVTTVIPSSFLIGC